MLHIISTCDALVLKRATSTITHSDQVVILGDIVSDFSLINTLCQHTAKVHLIFTNQAPPSNEHLTQKLAPHIALISFDDFVQLSVHHFPIITWQ